ncbi:hypothetical protein [Amycolatopsis samaneae]|uniref:Uncharacterized protein n=1 Tax=Amycolatopsis samaneae TaxID=664691 RepID=A0ABW5GR31_9PSEU
MSGTEEPHAQTRRMIKVLLDAHDAAGPVVGPGSAGTPNDWPVSGKSWSTSAVSNGVRSLAGSVTATPTRGMSATPTTIRAVAGPVEGVRRRCCSPCWFGSSVSGCAMFAPPRERAFPRRRGRPAESSSRSATRRAADP